MRGIKRKLRLMQVEVSDTSRALPFDPLSPLAFRVVAQVPIAFRFHADGNLEFVDELEHRSSLRKGMGVAGLAPAAS